MVHTDMTSHVHKDIGKFHKGGGSSHDRKIRMSIRQRAMKNMSDIRMRVSNSSEVRRC